MESSRHDRQNVAFSEPIAVIGTGCRFPGGADSPAKLWDLICESRDVGSKISSTRFNGDGFHNESGKYHGSTNAIRAYQLEEDCRLFDNAFFGIRTQEAESMDPQQRILLETVYESLESAGYSMQQLQGSSTGVYVGQFNADFYDIVVRDVDTAPEYAATGTSRSIMSNRVSYFFDWRGPSMTIDTACSSSLVAVHHAVQSLRSGESTLAVAAGVNLILGPEPFIFESQLGMLSPTGRSRMWDAKADGYARGDGFAAVVLKKLSQAIADGDDIECIIRETGVNQDGRTMGITMPSSEAQAALIRTTYAKCGLDPLAEDDRCQYFEAHGTGTPAGDPIEARAIQSVFFPDQSESAASRVKDSLLVGSVKTVIGHTEGTAGLAGLIKASQAIKHGIVPPNMHFETLSPAVAPYYQHLQIPTSSHPWPNLRKGVPRRASVNSFGFGGTNSHAIIESWEPQHKFTKSQSNFPNPLGPVVISANSARSLVASVSLLSSTLKRSNDAEINDILWTLQTRRSEFPFKVGFVGSTRNDLVQHIDEWLEKHPVSTSDLTDIKRSRPLASSSQPSLPILGIFTGQGAQWPKMGAMLLQTSQSFRKTLKSLDKSLSTLEDAPNWSLEAELSAPPETSRVSEAAISQPLCTAVQIALVDLLASSGIRMSRVVGHSSGEIGAAYAAGYITATDGIRIAYYRGICAKLASGKGRMMAVDMTLDDARAFCSQPAFQGRITVAASNAPSSVTMSGDTEAIQEALNILVEEKGIFARVLQVDTAYHSPHMQICAPTYSQYLEKCNITARSGSPPCTWFSSVHPGTPVDPVALTKSYWIDNMVQPVLFSGALETALADIPTSLLSDGIVALEIGPHPALKRPAMDTAKAAEVELSYSGVLKRGKSDMEAFCEALGFVWCQFVGPSPLLDFNGFRKACLREHMPKPRVVKGLPGYAWDHESPVWRESRLSKNFRTRQDPIHPLLGARTSNDAREIWWRNILRLRELEWLRGHSFQGQVLFPAQGYVSMVVEACLMLMKSKASAISMIELTDVFIHRAITLEEHSDGIEVLSNLRIRDTNNDMMTIDFAINSSSTNTSQDDYQQTQENFTCQATLLLDSSAGSSSPLLPPRIQPSDLLSPIDTTDFYSHLKRTGLQYSGDFLAESVKHDRGVGVVRFSRPQEKHISLHPATLDIALHGLFIPGFMKGATKTFLPTAIDRIRIDMRRLLEAARTQSNTSSGLHDLVADCYPREASAQEIRCDIDISGAHDQYPEVQMEGVVCSPFGTISKQQEDRVIFSKTVWRRDISHGIEDKEESRQASKTTDHDSQLAEAVNRVTYFYLRKLRDELSEDAISASQPHFRNYWTWAMKHSLPPIESGQHPRVHYEDWKEDTDEMIRALQESHPDSVDLKTLVTVGEALPQVLKGHTSPLELLMQDGMLSQLYEHSIGLARVSDSLAAAVSQIAHRYQHMRILEVGAGTGGATSSILQCLGGKFASYTFSDITAGFFDKADERLNAYSSQGIEYRTLDISRDPTTQGFQSGEFDLVIASNVIYATASLSETLRNCRQLLRPGGYLAILECTAGDVLHTPFIFGTLPGWWLGATDGRALSPLVGEARWDALLAENGFSGIDVVSRDLEDHQSLSLHSVMISQAVDDRVMMLREPLLMSEVDSVPGMKHPVIMIVGAEVLAVSTISRRLARLLRPFAASVIVVDRFEDVDVEPFASGAAVICLSELQQSLFRNMTSERFSILQTLLLRSTHLLWLTRGGRDVDPYASIGLGIARSVMAEAPGRPIHFVDTEMGAALPSADWLASALLRMLYLERPEFNDNMLWTKEAETFLDATGAELLPRVLPDQPLNNRLNSKQRTIERDIMPKVDTSYSLTRDHSGTYQLAEKPEALLTFRQEKEGHLLEIDVHYSSLCGLMPSDATSPLYICAGLERISGQHVIALSTSNASRVAVLRSDTWEIPIAHGQEQLLALLRLLLAKDIVSRSNGRRVWLHEADPAFYDTVRTVAGDQGVQVFASTSYSGEDIPSSYTSIHPRTTARRLQLLAPKEVGVYANLSRDCNSTPHGLIQASIGKSASVLKVPHMVEEQWMVSLSFNHQQLSQAIETCLSAADSFTVEQPFDKSLFHSPMSIVSSDSSESSPNAFDVVDWAVQNSDATYQISIRPLDASCLFSSDRLYFLAGLTGSVGMSLCKWMADNGACHFAVASRKPVVDDEARAQLEIKGAKLHVFAMDLTSKDSVKDTYKAITAPGSGFPPIGGVVNGAMVLSDGAFENMSLEDFEYATKPKVQGSQNLDDVFGQSAELEFFIFLSSITGVIGAPGVSNYVAANLFMGRLAQQRRRRGLPGSVLDIGVLAEVGYLTRSSANQTTAELERRYNTPPLSESDLHAMFAEAVLAGGRNFDEDADIHIGMGFWDTSNPRADRDIPGWFEQPRLSYYLIQSNDKHDKNGGQDENTIQDVEISALEIVKEQLICSGTQNAMAALEDSVVRKLGQILHISIETLDVRAPLMALGLDSLVAIQVRTWLSVEFDVHMPALKILASPSIRDLSAQILEGIQTALPTDVDSDLVDKEKMDSLVLSPLSTTGTSTPSTNALSAVMPDDTVSSSLDLSQSEEDKEEPIEDQLHMPGQIEREKPIFVRTGEMSHGQSRIYFLHKYLADKTTYNCSGAARIEGPLSISGLKAAISTIIQRHEIFRSAFYIDEATGKGWQGVMTSANFSLSHKEMEVDSEIVTELESFKKYEFDLEHGETMRLTVLSKSATQHHLVLAYHHLVMDGISFDVFLHELEAAYKGERLPTPGLQSIDLSAKQRAECDAKVMQSDLKFWANVHRDAPPSIPLFSFAKAKYRKALYSYDTHDFEVKLGPIFAQHVRAKSAQTRATPFHLYLAALSIFLSRWLDVSDVNIGIVDANRRGDASSIGYFLNMLALRMRPEKDTAFQDLVARSRDDLFAALEHSTTPFDAVLDHLQVSRGANHHPLFQVALNYRVGNDSLHTTWGDCRVQWTDIVVARNPFDLHVDITAIDDKDVWLKLGVQSSLYTASDAEMLAKSFSHVLECLVSPNTSSNIHIGHVPIASDSDRRSAARLGEGPELSLQEWPATLVHRIDDMAAKYPDDLAIRAGLGAQLTYKAMLRRVKQLSSALHQRGVEAQSYVAVYLPASADALCAMLAIMRLGAIYVPLDRRNPAERLALMVSDSQPRVLIHGKDDVERAHPLLLGIADCFLLDLSLLGSSAVEEVDITCTADQVACIIFTSGSTGRPKGVLMTHRNLLNQTLSVGKFMGVGREVVMQQSSLGFDCSTEQIFGGLAHGGTVFVVPDHARGDSAAIADIILSEAITYTVGVPSEYAALLRWGGSSLAQCRSWRLAISGGEKLTASHVAAFARLHMPGLSLVNAYGPAEGTVSCTRGFVDYKDAARQDPSMGSVLPNYSVVVVDSDLQPVPVGFPGEICIGGAGVTRGYLKRPEETAKRFLTNPSFVVKFNTKANRFYRTGDAGRFAADGTLHSLGRIEGDSQVQLSGMRVELDEIAAALVRTGGSEVISDAAVSLRDVRLLVAFVVFAPGFAGDKTIYLQHLVARLPLPTYMRPSIAVPVDQLPRTANGKRDRRAIDTLPIPAQDMQAPDDDALHPLTDLETQVKEVWQEVLPTAVVTSVLKRDSDFFHVGGNSLLLLRLQSVLRTTFSLNIALPELFQSSSLGAMAMLIETERKGAQASGTLSPALINWNQEITSLSDGLGHLATLPTTNRPTNKAGLVVILTGATGFLGKQILSRLIANPSIQTVHCIAVRPAADGKVRQVTETPSSKVIVHNGNLNDRYLGLSHEMFTEVATACDVIIHNGAEISFMKTYASLRRPNVLSTRALIEMALIASSSSSRNVPLHFVSTAGTTSFYTETGPIPPISLASSYPPPAQANSSGYNASKWVAEALLERCATEHSALHPYIHRPTSILGEGAPHSDVVGSLVRHSEILRAAPPLNSVVDGLMNFVEVQDVAAGIVRDALASVTEAQRVSGNNINFVHHCNKNPVFPQEFPLSISKRLGYPVESCDLLEWLDRAKERGLDTMVENYLRSLVEKNRKAYLPLVSL